MSVRVRAIFGCPVRFANCLRVDRQAVPECDHMKENPKLRKALLDERDSAQKKSPQNVVTVYCPRCQRALDQTVTTEVLKWTGEVPSKHPHIHMEQATGLQSSILKDGEIMDGTYVVVGKIVADGDSPWTQRINAIPETVKQAVVASLTKAEIYDPQTLGLYLTAHNE